MLEDLKTLVWFLKKGPKFYATMFALIFRKFRKDKDLGFKKILGIEPAKNLAKLANKNKIKTFNGFLEKNNLSKIKKNADLILASNVFAHSDKLKEMAECMLKLLNKKGILIGQHLKKVST